MAPHDLALETERPRGEARREALLARLRDERGPVAGGRLADELGVSRQAIVQDVAVLRASGAPIVATIRGYLLERAPATTVQRAVFAVRHSQDQARDELLDVIDAGGSVVDVIVEHPIYGDLRGALRLASAADVRAWTDAVTEGRVHLLSELTDGVHLHTIEAPTTAALERVRTALRDGGYLLEVGD